MLVLARSTNCNIKTLVVSFVMALSAKRVRYKLQLILNVNKMTSLKQLFMIHFFSLKIVLTSFNNCNKYTLTVSYEISEKTCEIDGWIQGLTVKCTERPATNYVVEAYIKI